MLPKVYIETSFVSYLTARPSREVVTLGRQQVTRDWWERERSGYERESDMREEEIVEEIHRVRREISAQFGDDVHAFFEYLRQREAQQPEQVVTLDRVPADVGATATANDISGRLSSR